MPKVFSLEVFKKDMIRCGATYDNIIEWSNGWAGSCDGLTVDEVKEKGYAFAPEWIIERKMWFENENK